MVESVILKRQRQHRYLATKTVRQWNPIFAGTVVLFAALWYVWDVRLFTSQ
jgi:hypothetical protein